MVFKKENIHTVPQYNALIMAAADWCQSSGQKRSFQWLIGLFILCDNQHSVDGCPTLAIEFFSRMILYISPWRGHVSQDQIKLVPSP